MCGDRGAGSLLKESRVAVEVREVDSADHDARQARWAHPVGCGQHPELVQLNLWRPDPAGQRPGRELSHPTARFSISRAR